MLAGHQNMARLGSSNIASVLSQVQLIIHGMFNWTTFTVQVVDVSQNCCMLMSREVQKPAQTWLLQRMKQKVIGLY